MQSKQANDIQYTLSYQEVVEVLRLVRESQSCASLALEVGDMKLHVTRSGTDAGAPSVSAASAAMPSAVAPVAAAAPQPVPVAPAVPAPATPAVGEEAATPVRAPLLGIFYRCPSPGAPAFVNEGDIVGVDDTVALIEVMKLFSSVTAGVHGRVVRIVAENGVMVEHGQTLMLIEPLQK
jgi:acetyl-CoA carboxylase biotin carboxyl carrier protein